MKIEISASDLDKIGTCDHDVPNICQYPVPCASAPWGEKDCGEPAAYRVWWRKDMSDLWWVCKDHFEEIFRAEKGEDGP